MGKYLLTISLLFSFTLWWSSSFVKATSESEDDELNLLNQEGEGGGWTRGQEGYKCRSGRGCGRGKTCVKRCTPKCVRMRGSEEQSPDCLFKSRYSSGGDNDYIDWGTDNKDDKRVLGKGATCDASKDDVCCTVPDGTKIEGVSGNAYTGFTTQRCCGLTSKCQSERCWSPDCGLQPDEDADSAENGRVYRNVIDGNTLGRGVTCDSKLGSESGCCIVLREDGDSFPASYKFGQLQCKNNKCAPP